MAIHPPSRTLILLELTRCNDSRQNSLQAATNRKEKKYEKLLQDLADRNNHWTVSMQTTAIGYLTSVQVSSLTSLYQDLHIPTRHHYIITDSLIKVTARAFAKMARERLTSLHNST